MNRGASLCRGLGLGLCLNLLLLAGCATPPVALHSPITSAMLVEGRPLTGGLEPAALPDTDILGVDPAMRHFITAGGPPHGTSQQRLRELLRVLLQDEGFVIEYSERTYTAAEAFQLRRANCLAFTNLFVALAREAGLTVQFQEVDMPPDWSSTGSLLIQNRHINTRVEIDGRGEQVVDFNMADFRASYSRRVISDERARAHYYSNVGVERMRAGEALAALLNFRKAIAADAGFTPAWINLGALYQRAGSPAWAVAAWRHALDLDPQELVALSNLERLYRADGQVAAADELLGRLARYRRQNPYYRFQLAEAAFTAADYDTAIAHLRFAISRKANEDRFYALLGLAYLRRGDPTSAHRWMARAEAVAGDQPLKDRYHSKLERLRQLQEGAPPAGT